MATAGTLSPHAGRGAARLRAARLRLGRQELAAAAIVAVAWAGLVFELGRDGHASMAGMHMSAPGPSQDVLPALAAGLPAWLLMTVAMMGPGALPGVRHAAINSLRRRRGRAMTGFSLAYLAVWAAFGAVAIAAVALVPWARGTAALAVVLAGAAVWQLTPAKRRSLRDCHRAPPLPPSGWRAEVGALRFGARHGRACIGSCWCLMLVMAVAPVSQLLWMVALTGITTTERLAERPRAATRHAATVLGLAALAMALAALA